MPIIMTPREALEIQERQILHYADLFPGKLAALTAEMKKRTNLRLEVKYKNARKPHLYFSNGKWYIVKSFSRFTPCGFTEYSAMMFHRTLCWIDKKNSEI